MAYKDSSDYGTYADDQTDPNDPNRPLKPLQPGQQLTYTNPEKPQVQSTTATGAVIPPGQPGPGPSPAPGTGQTPQQFIAAWQADPSHAASGGIEPLAAALSAQFPGVSRFNYGANGGLSNNEFNINGEKFKVLGGEGTPGAYWYKPGTNDAAPGGTGSGGGFDVTQSVFGKGGDPRSNKLFDLLMQRASATPDASPDNPLIKRQVGAYGAAQTRAERDYESALAERLGSNANMGAERRIGAEHVGQATSGFQAQLIQQELGAERQQIESALSGAAGLLTSEQSMQLQERLHQLDLAQNAYQFDVTDEFRRSPLAS